jgi:hypothetical protein
LDARAPLREGLTVGGVELSAALVSRLAAVVITG